MDWDGALCFLSGFGLGGVVALVLAEWWSRDE